MMDPPLSELDASFEPQQRARSNTWPLPRPDALGAPGSAGAGAGVGAGAGAGAAASKKGSSRRNAWGNLSYADLITQAIASAPDKRLTLSQIYDWMVHNVPYFKDKGDSNSSAGWKNSIRHNLSLHSRFMRVQNEGTGKSSWWMINPDAKPGKSARRRAASMETSKFERRRGRVKKKVDALRSGLAPPPDATPSPSSSVSESLDLFPESPLLTAAPGGAAPGAFQLSPDFRPRASSNASSGGRLSPIPAVLGVEPDWASTPTYPPPPGYGPEQLAGNLAESMKLHQSDAAASFMQGYPGGGQQQQQQQQQQPPPPPYQPPYEQQQYAAAAAAASRHPQYGMAQCHLHRLQSAAPSYPHSSEHSPDSVGVYRPRGGGASPPTIMGQLMGALNNSSLLDDLNLNIEALDGGFDCNVDEVIRHELSMEGSLDFNFQQGGAGAAAAAAAAAAPDHPHPPPGAAPSWVH